MLKIKTLSWLSIIFALGCAPSFKALTVTPASKNSTSGTTTTTTTTTTIVNPPDSDGTGGYGGQTGTHTLSCGSRSYIIKVPVTYNSQTPIPILVWFHGLGDNYQNFANQLFSTSWSSIAESEKFILMIPAHQNPNRPSFLFLDPSETQLDEPSTKSEVMSVYDCVINGAGHLYNLNRKRIHWAGFSEGGTFTSLASSYLSAELRNATPFAGGAPRRPPVTRLIPVYYIVGTADSAYSYVQNSANQFEQAGHPVNRSFIPGVGHALSPLLNSVGPQNIWNWMKSN